MKNIIKYLKASTLLTAFCGLFSLGCLTLDHTQKKAERVSAYNNIVGLTLTNGSTGSIDSYTFRIQLEKESTFFTDEAYLSGLIDFKIYYTGVNDFMNIDFNFNFSSFYYFNSYPRSQVITGLSNISDFKNIPLTTNGNTPYKFVCTVGDFEEVSSTPVVAHAGFDFKIFDESSNSMLNFNQDIVFSYFSSTGLSGTLDSINLVESNTIKESVNTLYNAMTYQYTDGYQNGLSTTTQESYENGYNQGKSDGWSQGMQEGLEVSQRDYTAGYNAGYNQAEAELTDFYESAQSTIYNNGYNAGYGFGYTDGIASMEEDIHEANISSYNEGYVDGYNNASTQDSTVATIFSGILQVALVPINFFLAIFNFEILGINLSGFIRALFTVAITIIIIKTIFGGKGASE